MSNRTVAPIKSLINLPLINQQNALLGQVQDLLIEPSTGKIQYLLINTNSQTFPVPVDMVQMKQQQFTTHLLLEVMHNSPAPPNSDLPALTHPYWQQLNAHYRHHALSLKQPSDR